MRTEALFQPKPMDIPPDVLAIIDRLIEREGGFVDHPADRGGPTRYGITMSTLYRWRGRPVNIDEVRELSIDEARQIYAQLYFFGPRLDHLPEALQAVALDGVVLHGEGKGISLVQEALNNVLEASTPLKLDGLIGPKTAAAARAAVRLYPPHVIIGELIGLRADFVRRIVERDPSQAVFLDGWLARLGALMPDSGPEPDADPASDSPEGD